MDLSVVLAILYFGLLTLIGVSLAVLTGLLDAIVQRVFVRPFEKVSSLLRANK